MTVTDNANYLNSGGSKLPSGGIINYDFSWVSLMTPKNKLNKMDMKKDIKHKRQQRYFKNYYRWNYWYCIYPLLLHFL